MTEYKQKEFFSTYVNLVYEVQELFSIYEGLSTLNDSAVSGKLKQFIKGPDVVTKENPNRSTNQARNIAFELLIASKLYTSGFEIDFGTDADLCFSYNGKRIFVECKRPQFNHQVNSNLKGAFKQLKNRYSGYPYDKNVFGVAALSVSKILNPDLDILVSKTASSMHTYIEKLLFDFHVENNKRYLRTNDERTIGLIVYFSTPVSIEDENIIAHSHIFDLTNCCDPKSKNYKYIKEIAAIMEKA